MSSKYSINLIIIQYDHYYSIKSLENHVETHSYIEITTN